MTEDYIVYCLKCKEKTKVVNPEIVQMNGKGNSKRTAIVGICEKCSVKMCRTIKKE